MGPMCPPAPSAGLHLLHMADVSCMGRPGRPLPVLIRSTQGQLAVLGGDFRLENWFSRFSGVVLALKFGHRGFENYMSGHPFLISITPSQVPANFGNTWNAFWGSADEAAGLSNVPLLRPGLWLEP